MKIQTGQAAVITGAGGGIGQAVALSLAQRQVMLALVDVDSAALEHTRQLLDEYAVAVSTHILDLADTTRLQTLPTDILAQHGRVDLLVNCAGVSLAAPLSACSADDLEWIIGINLLGLMQTCRAFLSALSQPGGGHIVNLSSDFGFMGFPAKSAYCATKFGVRGFSEALRIELAGSGIGVTCVYPGAVDTGFIQKGRAWDAARQTLEAQFVQQRSLSIQHVAQRILRGVERDQPRVLIGKETYGIDLFSRIFPALYQRWLPGLRRFFPFAQ